LSAYLRFAREPSAGGRRHATSRLPATPYKPKGFEPDINVSQAVPDDLSGRIFIESEASLHRHLKPDGDEQSGSQSYVPGDKKDDRALQAALDLVRGVTANAAFPPNSRPDFSGKDDHGELDAQTRN
jgi:hypothetical protein